MKQSKGLTSLKNEEEACAYKKESGSSVAFLILYVDDILLIGNDIPMLESEGCQVGPHVIYMGMGMS